MCSYTEAPTPREWKKREFLVGRDAAFNEWVRSVRNAKKELRRRTDKERKINAPENVYSLS